MTARGGGKLAGVSKVSGLARNNQTPPDVLLDSIRRKRSAGGVHNAPFSIWRLGLIAFADAGDPFVCPSGNIPRQLIPLKSSPD